MGCSSERWVDSILCSDSGVFVRCGFGNISKLPFFDITEHMGQNIMYFISMAENDSSSSGSSTAPNFGGGDMSPSGTVPDFSHMIGGDMRKQLEALHRRQASYSTMMEQYNNMEQMKIISEMAR